MSVDLVASEGENGASEEKDEDKSMVRIVFFL